VTKQGVARLAMAAEESQDKTDGGPGQQRGQAAITSDHRKELNWDLARRNPPRNHWGQRRGYNKAEQLSRDPALDFGPRSAELGAAPDEVIPGKQASDDGKPSVHGGLVVEPKPNAEEPSSVMRVGEPWQNSPRHRRIARHGGEQRDQAHQLKPLARGHSSTADANAVLGLELLPTALAEEILYQRVGCCGHLHKRSRARAGGLLYEGADLAQVLRYCRDQTTRISGDCVGFGSPPGNITGRPLLTGVSAYDNYV